MKLTRLEFKLVKKIQKIIDFLIHYKNFNYYRNMKHNGKRKIKVSYRTNLHDTLWFGGTEIAHIGERGLENLSIGIGRHVFELREYSDDEIFNLSTIYSNEVITAIKVFSMLEYYDYKVSFYIMDYQLICDVASAIDTQFKRIDMEGNL